MFNKSSRPDKRPLEDSVLSCGKLLPFLLVKILIAKRPHTTQEGSLHTFTTEAFICFNLKFLCLPDPHQGFCWFLRSPITHPIKLKFYFHLSSSFCVILKYHARQFIKKKKVGMQFKIRQHLKWGNWEFFENLI